MHTQFHNCPAVGVAIPLVEVQSHDAEAHGRNVLVMREDYAGAENPLASVRTERFDGSNDVTVLAPTATAGVK